MRTVVYLRVNEEGARAARTWSADRSRIDLAAHIPAGGPLVKTTRVNRGNLHQIVRHLAGRKQPLIRTCSKIFYDLFTSGLLIGTFF